MTLEEFFTQWKSSSHGFNLSIGTPLPDGSMVIYFHTDSGESPTVNYKVVGDSLTLLQQNEDGTLSVVGG